MPNPLCWSPLLVILLAGCARPEGDGSSAPPASDSEDPDPADPTGDASIDETGTPSTGDTAPEVPYDCAAVPVRPLGIRQLDGPRGYHGLAFDQEGNIIGSDGSALLSVSYDGDVSVLVPSLGTVQGMDWLPDGDLAVAVYFPTNAIVRVAVESGAVTPLVTDLSAYGLVTGPNGMLYAADRSRVYRIDPDTGTKEVFVGPDRNFYPQSINFSPDHRKFYMTSQSGWALWETDLDEDLERISPKRRLADFGRSFRDGLAVDWCGNLYVPDYTSRKLFRISPEGQVQTLVNFREATHYGHAAVFGSGIGGWKHDALYMPQPYDDYQVIEVELGVPGRSWVF